ncbi:MAG TPA: glycosyltransferase [Microvirga sp.]|jgi:glycosyltransferase involved in cell wall biosynthesis
MRICFVHQNFPGQFVRLAATFAAEGHEVVGLGTVKQCRVPGVRYFAYETVPGPDKADFSGRYFHATHRLQYAYAVAHLARALQRQGFEPDLVVVNTGWGENLFLRDIWPKARHVAYFEYYHLAKPGEDIDFDPEFPTRNEEKTWQMRIKNALQLAALDVADAAVAPTRYQRDLFPAYLRDRIAVIHDGIGTDQLRPDPDASIRIGENGPRLDRSVPVVTNVVRNIEPMRGSHVFIRSLPALLALDPRLHVICVGGSGTSYGARPAGDRSWYDIFRAQVEDQVDWSRVHFVGQIPYSQFVRVLQVSSAHVYLTYPFVLSWSMLEAMSLECRLVASDTAPVREVARDGENARLFPFFDRERLVEQVRATLSDPEGAGALAAKARRDVVEAYDFGTVALPQWRAFLGVPGPQRPS